ncbi:miz sp-ring zinc finger [Colletotrichum incanum]|uniref:Miz sp-ring zinc finger n=1 Tax=Colletotrichum incanum TaxID=1573173 RepID=A0A161Y099_COLIC|nr:miz sp-ring zinc finger [Colletotrichum incanum]
MTPHEAHHNGAGGYVSGAQVAASNQTLNFMLGNHRQPSWMTGQHPKASTAPQSNMAPISSIHQGVHGPSRRPSSRPPSRTSTNSISETTRLPPGSVAAVTSNPADGPQDKPAAVPESGQQILDCAAALPSPAPTDQPSPPTASSNQSAHQNPDSCVQSSDSGFGHLTNTCNTIPSPAGGAFTQDRPADAYEATSGLVSEPAVSGMSNTTLLPENNHSSSRSVPFEPRRNPTRFEPSDAPQNRFQDPVSVTEFVAPLPTAAAATIADPQPHSGQAATSPPSNGQLAAPGQHTQHLGEGNNVTWQTVASPEANIHPAESLRPRAMAENLDSFVRFCGGVNNIPDDGTSMPRVRLLKDAIETGDYFYIVLHQVLCVWSIDREAAQGLLGLGPDVAESALNIIQNTLRKNDNMTQRLVHFFANFPNTRTSGLWETEAFRKHASDVSVFLNNLHEQWNRIHIPAMRSRSGRGYPILADELRYQLKLRSPLLESIFFTVTRRHIGVPDGPIADQMMALFRQDAQNDHAKVSEQEQRLFQHSLISKYKQLVHQSDQIQQQQLRQQTYSSPATRVQQPLPQDVARPQAMSRQQTMPEQARRHSAGFSPTQASVPTPTQSSPVVRFDMYPSPPVQSTHQFQRNFPNNPAQVPSQLRLRSHNSSHYNSGAQQSMQQNPMRMPQMVGQMNRPLTPADSPHYASAQLPYAARMSQSLGQTSSVLQPPLGGLSISIPAVTSPTQSMAPQGVEGRSPGLPQGQQLPQLRPFQPQGFQQASNANADSRRQTAHQEYQQRQVQAIAQRQVASLVSPQAQQIPSPRLQQVHQVPSQGRSTLSVTGHLQLNPHVPGAVPGVTANHQVARPPTTRSKVSRDASGRLRGNVFAPPHMQIPLDRQPHTPWEPKALSMALHQVGVRSPRRVPQHLPSAGDPTRADRYYQFIKKLAVGPVATPAKQALHRLVFIVPHEDIGKLCPSRALAGDGIPVSEYFNGSLRYRLRLCEMQVNPEDPANVTESTWAVAQTYWPDHINIFVNGKAMTIRRKQHNGQHQPVELTPFVFAGTNSISVAISPPSRPQKPNTMYYMAVEIIETLSHEHILNMVLQHGVISAGSTREAIQKRLKPAAEDEDDELTVVGNDLSVDLADPFSATIFQIPVRGASCAHMECFDLVTWLQTRPSKPRCTIHAAGDDCRICNRGLGARPEPSLVDKWKCPLCDGDARPYSLRKDEFMADVRAVLEMEGKLYTKTIYVAADGTWRPKVEEVDDGDDDEAEDEKPPAKRARVRGTPSEAANAVEVIELD